MLQALSAFSQKKDISVLAYYVGGQDVDSFAIEKLTHIIYSFCHLKGNKLAVDDAKDSAMIRKLVSLKSRNPGLKVMLSLGGWGGCASCSEVFSQKRGRREFAKSVKVVNDYFKTDGLDLDWEYPAVKGYPGHKYSPDDKKNFTALVKKVRKKLGWQNELSFAVGGSKKIIDSSIEWQPVMKEMNRVNLMSYDLVGGYSKVTGHHTPLYSTEINHESVQHGVEQIISKGVDKNKIVIGAAFYGRMWENVADSLDGLYQQGKFVRSVQRKYFATRLSPDSGFVYHWDTTAHAPWIYNAEKKLFITYESERSIAEKTKYVIDNGLGGIMFWQLGEDLYKGGLLDAIYEAKLNAR
jgi:chitinase